MLRSMFTAISSLNLHQTYLDVVANNLANANTIGYKASRVVFQDQFAQILSPGASPSANSGGVNPIQIGLGSQLGYISPIFTQGMLQATGRNMDLAIQGDGFLVYDSGAGLRYSREGSLSMDSDGFFVNSSTGMRIQGWMTNGGTVDPNLPPSDIQIQAGGTLARSTESAIIGGNASADTAVGDTISTTMGLYDSLGNMHTATVDFTRTGPTLGDPLAVPPVPANPDNTWSWSVTDPAGAVGSGTITFDPNGQYSASTVGTAVSIPGGPGANAVTPTFDMTSMTMLASDTSVSVTSQTGLPAGSISDVYITPKTGEVFLIYSNGMREQVAQLAVARFNNSTGLIKTGNTMFQQGLNSGEAQIGLAGSGGRGTFAAGYLEASNVDMAQEFTNMILAQRGFQASSRVITTSDEILQELVNLKR
ncbi:MAG: flagellar hook-basal body protein [Chloroflexi bacterium HGW-Chloroflexi-10]|nr:MAG: flagellar hook-basal body protein [Chloroflexi bacterium HGW-Chloroflexi-10]